MRSVQFIRHFYFDHAQYRVSDGRGDDVILFVNYKENSYEIKSLGQERNDVFRKEIDDFARDLLLRKHKTDFAQK